jgi:endonuclease/exonuclease/phosphatase family metal-dependent hydrolase
MKKFRKILRISIKVLLIVALFCIVAFVGFLIYTTARDYKPAPITKLEVVKTTQRSEILQSEFLLLTWNIGYCGLGKEMDFFYDGGKYVHPGEEDFQRYLNGVYSFIARYDSVDFILLQEVDANAHRSYYTNQVDLLKEDLPNHASTYACNYKVDFVPLPVTNPMGKVESGLMTFSHFVPAIAQRYAFPLNYAWPMGLFMLDRCFIMERFALPDGKELVILNTHNSAFDDANVMRQYELWMLRGFLLNEYEKGNYVIAGGDWNQNPAGYNDRYLKDKNVKNPQKTTIEKDFLPAGWHWAFDPDYPTNRDVSTKYIPGSTLTQTIDFFVASPNLSVDAVKVIPTGFEFSDHQPVFLKVHLIQDPMQRIPEEYADAIKTLQDSVQVLNDKLGKNKVGKGKTRHDRFYQRK